MGISLQVYRIVIGSFVSNQKSKKVCNSAEKKSLNSGSLIYVLCFLLFNTLWLETVSWLQVADSNLTKPNTEKQLLNKSFIWSIESDNNLKFIKNVTLLTDVNFYARYINGNITNRGLKIVHWNLRSAYLENKMHEIETVVANLRPHLLGISESNYFKSQGKESVNLDEYDLLMASTLENPSLEVSRVVIYKHKSIVAKIRKDLMSDKFSSIWVEVGFPNKKKIIVCQLYREHQYLRQQDSSSLAQPEQLARWLVFLEQWERALETQKECIVLGDSNIDHLFIGSPQLSQYRHKDLLNQLCNRIYPLGVKQCVQGYTHSRPGQRHSLLDVVYTNNPQKLASVQTIGQGNSDHKIISVVRNAKNIIATSRYTKKRTYKNFDEGLFTAEVDKISWWSLYQSTNVDQAVDIFTEKISQILDVMAPVKVFQTRKKYVPWLGHDTKSLMMERDGLLAQAKNSGLVEDWNEFRKIRNKVTCKLRADKENWERNSLNACGKDSSKLWKNILGWLNWSSSGAPNKLFNDGKLETSPKSLANIMNNFYIDKIKLIRSSLPVSNSDPLKKLKMMVKNSKSEFSVRPVHPDLIDKVISNLKNSKSSGLDNIDTYILKLIKPSIVPAVTHIVNLSIQTSTFPSKWKYSKIIPLHKKDDPLSPKNYRPVALIPVVSKVLERVIFLQMVKYMERNSLFHPNHHGYRTGHNTCTALIQLYDSWVEALEREEVSGVMMVDLSAAFDCVDHPLLLEKLKLLGFDEKCINWCKSFLQSRYQCVYIEGAQSEFLSVDVGVPQRSILGPLFYILYTNDLPEVIHEDECDLSKLNINKFNTMCPHCGGLVAFADDSTVTVTDRRTDRLTGKLTEKYLAVSDYFAANKLKVNDEKTHLVIMTSSRKREFLNNDVSINTPSEVIKPSVSERLLGIDIHEDMKWQEYLLYSESSLLRSLQKRLNALKRIRNVASFKTRLMIANGIFCSKILYCLPLFGGADQYVLRRLQVVQNEAARIVTKLGRRTPIADLLIQTGWLSISQLVFLHSVLLVAKVKNSGKPEYLAEKIKNDYRYDTRISRQKYIQWGPEFKATKSLTLRSWRWFGTANFNKIPPAIRNTSDKKVFKIKLVQWIRENISI